MPRVSVICPTFNRSDAIGDTIDSVLAQRLEDWELIVVSDGSTDDTDEVVATIAATDRRIQLIRTDRRHGQPAIPRNVGIAHAHGAVIAYLDHDDAWRPDHLGTVTAMIDDGADVAATGAIHRDGDGAVTLQTRDAHLFWHPEIQLLGPTFEPSRVAHRAGLVERVGGWRPGAGLEDWDLWLRLSDSGASFATSSAHTAHLLADTVTRRHRMACRHHVTVAAFATARAAAQALSLLQDVHDREEFWDAIVADIAEWYRPMSASEEFVTPIGWSGDPVAEVIASLDTTPAWSDLVVVKQGDQFTIARPVACHTADHARRIQTLADRIRHRQTALARSIIEAGRP